MFIIGIFTFQSLHNIQNLASGWRPQIWHVLSAKGFKLYETLNILKCLLWFLSCQWVFPTLGWGLSIGHHVGQAGWFSWFACWTGHYIMLNLWPNSLSNLGLDIIKCAYCTLQVFFILSPREHFTVLGRFLLSMCNPHSLESANASSELFTMGEWKLESWLGKGTSLNLSPPPLCQVGGTVQNVFQIYFIEMFLFQ